MHLELKKPVVLMLAIALVCTSPLALAAQGPEPDPEAPSEPSKHEKLIARIWWNQPKKVSELQLSDTQRSKMDDLLLAYLEHREQDLEVQREAFSKFGAVLTGDDESVVEQRSKALTDAMSSPLRRQVDLMIEVVDLLTPEQRAGLASRYPKLLSRMWIRSVTPRSGLLPRGRGKQGG